MYVYYFLKCLLSIYCLLYFANIKLFYYYWTRQIAQVETVIENFVS